MKIIYNGVGFGHAWGIIPMIFFIFVLGMIAFVIIKMIMHMSTGGTGHGYPAPVLTVESVLIHKRMHMENNYTWYFMTFQFESGDRVEFAVNGSEYGMCVEGDKGRLTFRGKEYLEFKRNN